MSMTVEVEEIEEENQKVVKIPEEQISEGELQELIGYLAVKMEEK